MAALLLLPVSVPAQMARHQMPNGVQPAATPFYREGTFHALVGLGIGAAALLAYRTVRARRHLRRDPVGYAAEGVLAVDLVDSTRLAAHHGDALSMRARKTLQDRTRAVAERHGSSFLEGNGDGCLVTFPSVASAVRAGIDLLRDLEARPADLPLGPFLAVRAGVSYGEILVDARGGRHGSAINRAFRLQALAADAFVRVDGEGSDPEDVPRRDRILIDEEAAQELDGAAIPRRVLGYCRLKGFSGLHRVWEVGWRTGE